MSLVSVLIPVTMLLVGFGLWAFFWAVRTGQFDDLDIPGWEMFIVKQALAGFPGTYHGCREEDLALGTNSVVTLRDRNET